MSNDNDVSQAERELPVCSATARYRRHSGKLGTHALTAHSMALAIIYALIGYIEKWAIVQDELPIRHNSVDKFMFNCFEFRLLAIFLPRFQSRYILYFTANAEGKTFIAVYSYNCFVGILQKLTAMTKVSQQPAVIIITRRADDADDDDTGMTLYLP